MQVVYYQPGVRLGTGKVSNTWDAMTGRSKFVLRVYHKSFEDGTEVLAQC
jgi:hypothetical protein